MDERRKQKKNMLVIGGNSFMGLSLLHNLSPDEWTVTVLNRGHTYWRTPVSNVFPTAHLVVFDRNKREDFVRLLKSLQPPDEIRSSDSEGDGSSFEWDAVIDFCAYEPEDMEDIVSGLKDRVKHYLFISTDSVYMVCAKPTHGGPIREDDDTLPNDRELYEKLAKEDEYGDSKHKCETVLKQAFAAHKFPYTSLRLPDVIGPYDRTDRHWKYQLWLRLADLHHQATEHRNKVGESSNPSGAPPTLANVSVDDVHLTKNGATRKLSFVYSLDVVSALMAAIKAGSNVFGQSFNIAQEEKPTLEEHLTLMAKMLGVTPRFRRFYERRGEDDDDDDDDDDDAIESYPSVTFGAIDITKATQHLGPFGWKPTRADDALRETCQFFDRAWLTFPEERPKLAFLPHKSHRPLATYLLDLTYQQMYQQQQSEPQPSHPQQ
eukprot:TRINITY_DN1376_c0_g1_i2.p1 TRINITY_DN1376_c0_g1~~TRINITY_DN1376_c0_g1_i2.p1  ORF type:complete len:433 (+),score=101.16 TRINITY_DN1376_c0_g1_i2:60-1358(+)